MSARKLGYAVIVLGLALVAGSVLVDYLGWGKAGIGSAQILGTEIGVALVAAGIGLRHVHELEGVEATRAARAVTDRLLNSPTIVWLLVGFVAVYVTLFVEPVFFHPDRRMHYITQYIQEIGLVGADLREFAAGAETLLSGTGGYENSYPPLFAVLLAPILLREYPENYLLMTALSLVSLVVLSLIIPAITGRRGVSAVVVLFFITALFSYGLQFELERGQFNISATTLCFLSIYIFHFHKRFAFLSYLLFCIAVQLKVWPAIFAIMLVRDWRDWKGNLFRCAALGIANFVLLFWFGLDAFGGFAGHLQDLTTAEWFWRHEHSLRGFMLYVTHSGLPQLPPALVSWLGSNASMLAILVVLYYCTCLFAILAKAFLGRERGMNLDLLVVCMVGAMILPPVSYDYKLALLGSPLALSLSHRPVPASPLRRLASIFLLIALALSYSVTLFPPTVRPPWLINSFPLLLAILTSAMLLNMLGGSSLAASETERCPEIPDPIRASARDSSAVPISRQPTRPIHGRFSVGRHPFHAEPHSGLGFH